MSYHVVFERIRRVLDSCKNKQQLRIGEDYCLRLIDKKYPFPQVPSEDNKKRELISYVKGRARIIENFWR